MALFIQSLFALRSRHQWGGWGQINGVNFAPKSESSAAPINILDEHLNKPHNNNTYKDFIYNINKCDSQHMFFIYFYK